MKRSLPLAVAAGAVIGVLGGMIGLGGAEFRLPLLIGVFGFVALQAVILNKAMSLIVVLTALPARLVSVPYVDLAPHWSVVVNLLCGSLIGAWVGATWATKMRSATLYKVLSGLLVLIAVAGGQPLRGGTRNPRTLTPVEGGRRRDRWPRDRHRGRTDGRRRRRAADPTIVLLYGVDIKLAGSLSLAVSLRPCSSPSPDTAVTRASASSKRTAAS